MEYKKQVIQHPHTPHKIIILQKTIQIEFIGTAADNDGSDLDAYLAEFVHVDGQSLTPTSFGAFNPVTNIWEPIAYTGTYGTNGFRFRFCRLINLGADVSGNSK